MTVCKNCNAKIEEDVKFCTSCGALLDEDVTVKKEDSKIVKNEGSSVVKKLALKLEANDVSDTINDFILPDNGKDLYELSVFFITKLSNFIADPTNNEYKDLDYGYRTGYASVYIKKFEEIKNKTEIILTDEPETLAKIITLYNKMNDAKQKNLAAKKKRKIRRLIITLVIIGVVVLGYTLIIAQAF